jgi:glycosyltransferase involved in cell wall biosynthesis
MCGRAPAKSVKRLIIFTTHPIQYQAPWFRALAATDGLEILVVFSYVPDAAEQGIGFGLAISWDIPLRAGYPSTVLSSRLLPERVPAFARRHVHGVGQVLDDFRPDAALVLGWQELSLVQCMMACRRRRVPVILRGESNALRRRPRVVSMLHRRYFGLAKAFLAIGRANAEFYRRSGVPENRIVTAGYFVDNDRFRATADALRRERMALRGEWAIPETAACFAFVGKLEPKKCVMHFLEALRIAAAKGASAHGLVVGTGEQSEEARRFVAAHRIPVSFAGFLNQTEIARAYVAADVLVLPSNYGETWGLVVNEAMATGLPAVVSDRIGSADDLVVDGTTGLVFPHGDRAALAACLVRLAVDCAGRLRLGAAAQARVHAEFSIARAVEGTRLALALALDESMLDAAA